MGTERLYQAIKATAEALEDAAENTQVDNVIGLIDTLTVLRDELED
jgi:hypothetical protein